MRLFSVSLSSSTALVFWVLLIKVNYNKDYIAIEATFIKEFLKYKQIDRKKHSETNRK